MKATELLQVFEEFIYNRYTPSDEGAYYGCDCGCGGDCYTDDSWSEAHNSVYEAREKLLDTLKELNVEIDIDELLFIYKDCSDDI